VEKKKGSFLIHMGRYSMGDRKKCLIRKHYRIKLLSGSDWHVPLVKPLAVDGVGNVVNLPKSVSIPFVHITGPDGQ